jgi:very-short-patch-repair endonuclease
MSKDALMATRKRLEEYRQEQLARPSRLEQAVTAALTAAGVPFEPQVILGDYIVGYLLPEKVVLEAYGCYWHCCAKCGFQGAKRRGYTAKRRYDAHRRAMLRAWGYHIMVLWEPEVEQLGAEAALRKVLYGNEPPAGSVARADAA